MIALVLAAGSAPASHTLPQGTGTIDSRCDNHSCSQVMIDAGSDPGNRLDTVPGGPAGFPLYWGDRAVCLADGTVEGCNAGDITSVQAGAGLAGGATSGDASLAVDFTPSGGDSGTVTTVARGDHLHDGRYPTKSDVSTSGTINDPGNPLHWTKLRGVPPSLADGVDADSGGDVSAVTAGSGLIGGGTAGEVVLAADPTVVQTRVGGSCITGAAIRTINADGTVACESIGADGGDADLLDGLDSPQFLRSDQSGTLAGSLGVTGNLGVGSTSPTQRLEVAGNIQLDGSNGGEGLIFRSQSAAGNKMGAYFHDHTGLERWRIVNDPNGDQTDDLQLVSNDNGNNVLTLLQDGNVGVGTTSPASKLDVNGDIVYRATGSTNRVHNAGGEGGGSAPSAGLTGSVAGTTTITNGNWATVQTVTLPTAGTYMITSNFRIRHDNTQGGNYYVKARLMWNDGTAKETEHRMVVENVGSINSNFINQGGSVTWIVDVQADGVTLNGDYFAGYSDSTWYNDVNGVPRIVAVRLY